MNEESTTTIPVQRNRRRRRPRADVATDELLTRLSQRVIGQPKAMESIIPYVQMYEAGLAPEGRPAGVFLLLGPTGTGKTKTVEALAEVLHGSFRNILRVDCGEFQMEHEVAKLVGAPPGYLGHRETHPMLNQAKLASVASEHNSLSIVLFDEIEKAAPSMTRLLLGVLDKATLRLGDNNTVNFERSLIFLTSNLGARRMNKELNPGFGFAARIEQDDDGVPAKLESIANAAAKRQFEPEFMNRIDVAITYHPLEMSTLKQILDQQLDELQVHIFTRLGERGFRLCVSPKSRLFLLRKGTSWEYGAREIKRTLHRHLMQPLARLMAEGVISPGASVHADLIEAEDRLRFRVAA